MNANKNDLISNLKKKVNINPLMKILQMRYEFVDIINS